MMNCVCIGVMCYGLGLFTAAFLLGVLEHSFDRYANIPWSHVLETTKAAQPEPVIWPV